MIVNIIPHVGFYPISHMGHALDLGKTLDSLEGLKVINISDKDQTFSIDERIEILTRQWEYSPWIIHEKTGGSAIGKAYQEANKEYYPKEPHILNIVIGQDRIKSQAEGLKKALEDGKIPEMNGGYWDAINIVTPGDPDRTHGFSGTKLRQAVADNDFGSFDAHLGPMFTSIETMKIYHRIKSAIENGSLKIRR